MRSLSYLCPSLANLMSLSVELVCVLAFVRAHEQRAARVPLRIKCTEGMKFLLYCEILRARADKNKVTSLKVTTIELLISYNWTF